MVPPDRYLGANIEKVQTANGSIMWATYSADYCKTDISNLEKTKNAHGKYLLQYGNGKHPYPPISHPEIDTSA